jgi:hypothetical protein
VRSCSALVGVQGRESAGRVLLCTDNLQWPKPAFLGQLVPGPGFSRLPGSPGLLALSEFQPPRARACTEPLRRRKQPTTRTEAKRQTEPTRPSSFFPPDSVPLSSAPLRFSFFMGETRASCPLCLPTSTGPVSIPPRGLFTVSAVCFLWMAPNRTQCTSPRLTSSLPPLLLPGRRMPKEKTYVLARHLNSYPLLGFG